MIPNDLSSFDRKINSFRYSWISVFKPFPSACLGPVSSLTSSKTRSSLVVANDVVVLALLLHFQGPQRRDSPFYQGHKTSPANDYI